MKSPFQYHEGGCWKGDEFASESSAVWGCCPRGVLCCAGGLAGQSRLRPKGRRM